MMNYYKTLSTRRSTWLKHDVGDSASPPGSGGITQTWRLLFALMLSFMMSQGAVGQVAYTQNFTTNAGGWTGFSHFTGATACGGSGGAMRANLYGTVPTLTLTSPLLGVSDGSLQAISFDYKVADWSGNTVGTANPWGQINVQFSSATAGPWTTIGTIDQTNHVVSGACASKIFTFTPSNGSDVFVRFVGVRTAGDFYMNFDNIAVSVISSPPNCATGHTPADAATNVARNPVLTWTTATGLATSYDVYFGSTPTPPLVTSTAGTSYTPTAPLMANTQYYWKVVPKNAIGDAVGCLERSFTTGSSVTYCQPTTTFGCTDGDVIARVILNTLDNNSGTGCPSGTLGYSDYSQNPALTTTLQAGSVYNLTVYAGQYPEGYAAWIDYNDDGIFSAGERVGFSVGQVPGSGQVGVLGASASFPIAVACNPSVGEHRLRVRAMYNTNGSAVTACGNNAYGEIEDYTITISEAAACPQPSGLTASNVTATTADLSWTLGCAETSWEIVVQPQGSGVPSGSGVSVASTTYAASFGPGVHEFYVRANCEGDGYSVWTGPYIFTAPACPALTSPANGTTGVPITAGAITLDWEPSPGAVSYDVSWGTTPGNMTVLGNTPGDTVNIININGGTTYYWSIAAVNIHGTSTGCAVWSFTTEIPPGDSCGDAISLDALTSPISATTSGFTSTYVPSCNTANTAPELFYSITVPAGFTLNIGQTTNDYDSVHSVFYGSCASQQSIVCTDDPDTLADGAGSQVTWVNSTGSTQIVYWVQDGYNAGIGTFTLGWSLTPPPITVDSFNPMMVCADQADGAVVTLFGTNFSDATMVELNGVSTPFSVINSTTIEVTLSAASSAGVFTVTNPYTSGTSASGLDITPNPIVEPITNGGGEICVGGTVDLESASPGGTWSSSDDGVAMVDANGIVTGIGGGNVLIYYSVTDNDCTTDVSTEITVIAPVISTNPQNATVADGDQAQFSVAASGGVAYQWRVSTDDGATYQSLSNDATYSGVDSNTLTISNTPSGFNGYLYSVVITATSPCADFTSANAMLTVGSAGIATQPLDANLCSTGDGEASFTVATSGSVSTIGWEVDTLFGFETVENGAYQNVVFSGADTETLSVSGVTTENNGWIFRAVLNTDEAYSNNALLNVYEGASIDDQPSAKSVCYSGGTTVFNVNTSGSVSGYQWQYSTDGVSYANVMNGMPVGVTYSGASTSNLSVTTTSATPNSGTYYYRVIVAGTAPCGSIESDGAQLLFNTPVISQQPVAASVASGGSAAFTVATSAPSPSYQWQYSANGTTGWANVIDATPAGVTYSGANAATLNVMTSGATAAGTRHYRAVVTSESCSVNSNSAALTIITYCASNATETDDTSIGQVTFGPMANPATPPAPLYNNPGQSATYTNFTGLPVQNFTQGVSYPLTVTQSSSGSYYTAWTKIFIDWNQDGDFNDPGEVYNGAGGVDGPSTAPGTGIVLSLNITVPLTAMTGPTRMRVVLDEFGTASSTPIGCGTYSYGETEDYTINVIPAPACEGDPVAGTASANPANICVSGTATLTATGYSTGLTGLSIQWHSVADGPISGATNPTYTTPVLSSPASYFLRVSCANGGSSDSNIVTVGINNPEVVSTTPASTCGMGSVTLQAEGSDGTTLNWFAASTGGSPLYSGSSFTTPVLTETTTYYVSANLGGVNESLGKVSSPGTDGSYIGTDTGLVFNATSAITINTATVYPTGTGTLTVALYNSAGAEIASTSAIPVSGSGLSTPVTIPIGLAVPTAGNGYRLLVKAHTGITGLVRDFTGPFPFSSANASVTGGWISGASATYYFFYNMSISTGCSSGRTAVTATVDSAPELTLSGSSSEFCNGETSETVTITSPIDNYDTYSWSPSEGVSGSAETGYTFNPATTTTYTLSGSQTSGSMCQTTATYTVTINPLPTTAMITPGDTTICYNAEPLALSVTGGTTPNVVAMSQNFNVADPSWTITNGGSSPAAGNFAYRDSPYTVGTNTFSTANGGKFVMANSDAGGSGTTTNTMITSPVFSTMGYESATLSFEHFYQSWTSGDSVVRLEISTNGGSTWTQLVNYMGTTVGTINSPANANVSLNSYLNQPNLRIRYNYVSTWGYWWVIDNVRVTGNGQGAITWSPVEGLFTDAAGTVPYTGGPASMVYAMPDTSGTYTAIVTSAAGCSTTSDPVTISVDPGFPFYVDNDGDGYGAEMEMACSVDANTPPAGYSLVDGDCDDNNASANPGASEILYNGIDDNCDGMMDEGNQITTKVKTNQCGVTLANIYTSIHANSVANATGYRFRITGPGGVQYSEQTNPWFQLTSLASYEYGTTYSIDVEVQRNGIWLGYYGVACNVSTPALATGSPSLVQCGTTIQHIYSSLYTSVVPFASEYRFRITNLTNTQGPNAVQQIDRNVTWFQLTQLASYDYGTTYQVEVAVRTTGEFSAFGNPCIVMTPVRYSTLKQCGVTYTNNTSAIHASIVPNVSGYRFRVTNLTTASVQEITPAQSWIFFNQIADFSPGTSYSVEVAVKTTGDFGGYGPACTITSAGASIAAQGGIATAEFKVVASPNPYTDTFAINITSSTASQVEVRVFDMIGKLLEVRAVQPSDVESQRLGSGYPSGVYNVIVTQGDTVKTLRVIKR